MKRLLPILILLLCAWPGTNLGGGVPAVGGGGCGSGDNCAPGTQALTTNADTDVMIADTNASLAAGHIACVYFRITGALDTSYHVPWTVNNATTTRYAAWPHATSSWATATPGLYHSATTSGSTFTGQTTNIYAQCVLLADGSGETGGTRMWIWEETAADTWTERADITRSNTLASTTDAAFLLGDGANNAAPNPFEILYAWVITADFGITYTDANAQTEIEKYLGCSIDPAGSNVAQVWSMTDASTSSEPNEVGSGTAMALTSITRTSRSAIWTDGGSGEASVCDL